MGNLASHAFAIGARRINSARRGLGALRHRATYLADRRGLYSQSPGARGRAALSGRRRRSRRLHHAIGRALGSPRGHALFAPRDRRGDYQGDLWVSLSVALRLERPVAVGLCRAGVYRTLSRRTARNADERNDHRSGGVAAYAEGGSRARLCVDAGRCAALHRLGLGACVRPRWPRGRRGLLDRAPRCVSRDRADTVNRRDRASGRAIDLDRARLASARHRLIAKPIYAVRHRKAASLRSCAPSHRPRHR